MTSQSVLHAPHASRTASVVSPASVFGGIVSFFTAIGRARDAQFTYERLARLSDAELASQGLTRNDLPRHAFESAFGAH